eukprot:9500410-Pyramimonas_sp.AAC.1
MGSTGAKCPGQVPSMVGPEMVFLLGAALGRPRAIQEGPKRRPRRSEMAPGRRTTGTALTTTPRHDSGKAV